MSDVVIVGAGLAGIACARALRSAGVAVRLIDKGRGIGGRMATRRAEIGGQAVTFDHGAQHLDDSEEAAALASLAPDAVAPWDRGDGKKRLVGTPGMASLPKALAEGLDVTTGTRVLGLVRRDGDWSVRTDAGETEAAHLVVTIPAPQLVALLGATHPISVQAGQAVMAPCLTLMAALDPASPVPFETRRDPNAVLTWIARNDGKPGRSAAFRTWVAQAGAAWSESHINDDRETTKARMLDMLCETLGTDPGRVRHSGLQGWRYGLVTRPLGQPFVADGTLWAGGDWCLGPKAQDAWRSGTAIARDVLRALNAAKGRRSDQAAAPRGIVDAGGR